jgi:lactoylglutathione lyase
MLPAHLLFYVPDVDAAVDFYETAFGFKRHGEDHAAGWAAVRSGEVVIAFLSEAAAAAQGHPYTPLRPDHPPPGIELVLTRAEVLPAYIRALLAGAVPLHEPALKADGRMVAFVRDLNGVIVELCAPEPA